MGGHAQTFMIELGRIIFEFLKIFRVKEK